VGTIEKCDPWSVMKDVEEKVSSKFDSVKNAVKSVLPDFKKDNPFARVAARLKNLTSKSANKADELKDSASGSAEKMVHSVKLGGKKLAKKAKEFVSKARESLNN